MSDDHDATTDIAAMSITEIKTIPLDQQNESNTANGGPSSGSHQIFDMPQCLPEQGHIRSQQSNSRPQPRSQPRSQPSDFIKPQAKTRIISSLKQLFGATNVPEAEIPSTEPLLPEGDFKDAERIPFVKEVVYVFPHAEKHISNQHRDRFPSVLDIFRQNIEQDPRLCSMRMTKTEYKLRMCGPDRTNAHPSILVGHPSNDYKNGLLLMQKLTQPHVREQYWYKMAKPGFRIYLWIGSSFQYLGRQMDTFDVSFRDQNWSLNGACIRSKRTGAILSTITCGIRFKQQNADAFALTTGHAFESYFHDDPAKSGDNQSGQVRDTESYTESPVTFADIEYDISPLINADAESTVDDILLDPPDQDATIQPPSYPSSGPPPSIKPHCVLGPPRGLMEPEDAYRDWALIHFDDDIRMADSSVKANIQESGIIRDVNTDDLRVLVLTSRSQGIMGTMNRIPTYITDSKLPHTFNEVWTVTTGTSEFHVGDSGSLVIGELDSRIYGYVMAINHSRELYIVPLAVTLAQISKVAYPHTPEVSVFASLSTTARFKTKFENLFTRYWTQLDKEVHPSTSDELQGPARVPNSVSLPGLRWTSQEDNKFHGLHSADSRLANLPPTAGSPQFLSPQLTDTNRPGMQAPRDGRLSHAHHVTDVEANDQLSPQFPKREEFQATPSVRYESSQSSEGDDPFFGINFGAIDGGSPSFLGEPFKVPSETFPDDILGHPQTSADVGVYLPLSPEQTPGGHPTSPEVSGSGMSRAGIEHTPLGESNRAPCPLPPSSTCQMTPETSGGDGTDTLFPTGVSTHDTSVFGNEHKRPVFADDYVSTASCVSRGLSPANRPSGEVPSINEMATTRKIANDNQRVDEWLDAEGLQSDPLLSATPMPDLIMEGVSDRQIASGCRTKNLMQPGRTYFVEGGGPITDADITIVVQDRNWADAPAVYSIPSVNHQHHQPETSNDAMRKWEMLCRDTDSVVSWAATCGTRRDSLPSLPDVEVVRSGNILRKLLAKSHSPRRPSILDWFTRVMAGNSKRPPIEAGT